VLRVESEAPDPGGDGPLPGTDAGSSGGRDAELGVVVPSLPASPVAEPPAVAPTSSPEVPPDPVEPDSALIDASELEPEVATDEPSEVVEETIALVESELAVPTVPDTVRSLEPEPIVVDVAVELSTVVFAGAVATGAGALESEDVASGDESPPLELLTSVVEPLDESASRRPFGALTDRTKGVLASVVSG